MISKHADKGNDVNLYFIFTPCIDTSILTISNMIPECDQCIQNRILTHIIKCLKLHHVERMISVIYF